MVMNISCKFEKASYNIFFVRAVMVKSLYTLRRCNEAKSTVSTGFYPVDTYTFNNKSLKTYSTICSYKYSKDNFFFVL